MTNNSAASSCSSSSFFFFFFFWENRKFPNFIIFLSRDTTWENIEGEGEKHGQGQAKAVTLNYISTEIAGGFQFLISNYPYGCQVTCGAWWLFMLVPVEGKMRREGRKALLFLRVAVKAFGEGKGINLLMCFFFFFFQIWNGIDLLLTSSTSDTYDVHTFGMLSMWYHTYEGMQKKKKKKKLERKEQEKEKKINIKELTALTRGTFWFI